MSGICSICQVNESKYTCPACGMKSCSLECVRRHKKQNECTGMVDQGKFILRKELSEDSIHINRDYNFLLNFGRDIQLGKSDVKTNAKNIFKRQYNPSNRNVKRFKQNEDADRRLVRVNKAYSNSPQTTIKRNNTLIIQLPMGMSRSASNKSGYDKKLSTFTWTIEWVLVDKQGKEYSNFISYRLKETLPVRDAVPMNILNNIMKEKEDTIDKDSLCFYLDNVVNLAQPNKSIIKLDPSGSLADALANKIVLEYPKIFITLDSVTWSEHVVGEAEAYGLKEDSSDSGTSDSDSSDSDSSDSDSNDSDNDSESGDSDSDQPEEESSKEPQAKKVIFDDDK